MSRDNLNVKWFLHLNGASTVPSLTGNVSLTSPPLLPLADEPGPEEDEAEGFALAAEEVDEGEEEQGPAGDEKKYFFVLVLLIYILLQS